MPVSGLPDILECILSSCLRDNSLTHWKIEGNASKLFVLIEFQKKCAIPASSDETDEVPLNQKSCNSEQEHICNHDREYEENEKFTNCNDSKYMIKITAKQILDEKRTCLDNCDTISSKAISPDLNDNEYVIDTTKKIFQGPPYTTGNQGETITSSTKDNQSPDIFDLDEIAIVKRATSKKRHSMVNLSGLSSRESLSDVEEELPKRSPFTRFKSLSLRRKCSMDVVLLNAELSSNNQMDEAEQDISKDNTKMLSKVIKALRRSACHCNECHKIIKASNKSKCTVCDIFICNDCMHNKKHNVDHKRFISLFSYPSDPNNEDYCRACGYINKIKHSYNVSFSCDMCSNYILCQGCMSHGMHGHHEEHLKPIVGNS